LVITGFKRKACGAKKTLTSDGQGQLGGEKKKR